MTALRQEVLGLIQQEMQSFKPAANYLEAFPPMRAVDFKVRPPRSDPKRLCEATESLFFGVGGPAWSGSSVSGSDGRCDAKSKTLFPRITGCASR